MSKATLKRSDPAPLCGRFALFFLLLAVPVLSAQPQPAEQSGAHEKDAPQQAAPAPADLVTIPDGTPLTLQLVSELPSSAKKGDTISFITLPLKIDGLVVIPQGTAISGTVVGREHKQMMVAIEKVPLPSGEVGTLRSSKEATEKPESIAGKRVTQTRQWVDDTAGTLAVTTFGIATPAALALHFIAGKRHQQIYPAGTEITVYFNGPLHVDRGAALKSQPPLPQGVAHVFFTDASTTSYKDKKKQALFCGAVRVSSINVPIKLSLSPGSYSFVVRLDLSHDGDAKANKKTNQRVINAEMKSARTAQLEVQEGHEYWYEDDGQELFAEDPLVHQAEFYRVQAEAVSLVLMSLPPQDGCPQVAQPTAQTSATAGTVP